MSAISGLGVSSMSMPQVVSGASMRMPPAQKFANLFQQIDTSGSGSISKAQFDQAFQTLNPPPAIKAMGADAVFSKLDPNGTGSVSKQDFINGMKSMMRQAHHSHEGNTAQGSDFAQILASSLNALNNAGSQSASSAIGATGNNINISA